MIEHGQSRDLVSPFLDDYLTVTPSDDHIEIHTSDRSLFKRCRRKWNWQSGLRENYIPLGQAVDALWFGSGWHFMLEDYFGYHKYPTVDDAIIAYKDAFRASELPNNTRDLMDIWAGMAHYYTEEWLKYHPEPYETLWVDGVPQVEVDVDVDITERLFNFALHNGHPNLDWLVKVLKGRLVIYRMTFDRVGIDEYQRLFIIDYKTARQIDTNKLSNDPQVESYYWGGYEFYGDQLDGIVWQQFLKAFPVEPDWLMSSNRFSMNKNQYTTYPLYRRAVKEKYAGAVPLMYRDILAHFAEQQNDQGDRFIRRDILRRNPENRRAAEGKILSEVLDMLNPGLFLYPNPTRDCTWDCPFKDPCLALDDGSDPQFMLDTGYEHWKGYKQDWKPRILAPDGTRYYA